MALFRITVKQKTMRMAYTRKKACPLMFLLDTQTL